MAPPPSHIPGVAAFTSTKKMFCINCGGQVSAELRHCPACEMPLSATQQTRITTDTSVTMVSSSQPEMETVSAEVSPPDNKLEAGRILGNRYEIRQRIGSGGMGTIYAARRIHIGDIVAVKVLRAEVVNDAQSKERFQREARAAARLHHPNAVVIHDFGQDPDGLTYIVMELLEGPSLREVISAERVIPLPKAVRIMKQACAAIEAAHRLGIIHRDIKPDNITLLDSHDEVEHVKILDFGIAKLLLWTSDSPSEENTLTQVGTVIGTPTYMSPEQCQGEPLDARSDIYSLGIVLYEMLTGVQPFTAKNSTQLVIKHVTEKPRPLTDLRSDLPTEIERVVLKALEKNPEDRQQSALDLSRELESAFASQNQPTAVEPRFTVPVESSSDAKHKPDTIIRERSRTPLYAALAVIALLLFGGLGWWVFSPAPKKTVVNKPNDVPAVSGVAAALPPEEQPSTNPAPSGPPDPPPGMILVIGGQFQMGRDDGDDIDTPSHIMQVKPFLLDKTEVTNEQYKAFVVATAHSAPPAWKDKSYPEGQDKFPVTDVTWEDASTYAKWAKKRLPTEEEWEYAARGNDGRLYPYGKEFQPGLANLKTDATTGKQKENLSQVGSYPEGQSPIGALDMVGNVWEWTASSLKAYHGGKLPAQEGYQNLKVIRGGSWKTDPKQATTTLRRGWPATHNDWPHGIDADYSATGFRCAQDVP